MTFYECAILLGKNPENLMRDWCPNLLCQDFFPTGTDIMKTRPCEDELGLFKSCSGDTELGRKCWNMHIEDHDPRFVIEIDRIRQSAIVCNE